MTSRIRPLRTWVLRLLLLAVAATPIFGCGSDDVRPHETCLVSRDSLDFGSVSVGETRTRTLLVYNIGNEDRAFSPAVSDSNFSLVSGDSSGWRLATGDSLELALRYSPRTEGTHHGRLELAGGSCPGVELLGRTCEAARVEVFSLNPDDTAIAVAVSPSGLISVSVETWDFSRAKYGYYGTLKTLNADGSWCGWWTETHAKAPQGIAVLPNGDVVMADPGWSRLAKGPPDGSGVTGVGVNRFSPGRFGSLDDLSVDPTGSVYLADLANTVIHQLDLDGGFIERWGCHPPRCVLADGLGNVYVSNETEWHPTWVVPPGLVLFTAPYMDVYWTATDFFHGLSLDANGWILGASDRGLSRYSPDLMSFERLPLDEPIRDVAGGPDGTVYGLTEDSVLVCTPEGNERETWPAGGSSISVAEDGSVFILSTPTVRHYSKGGVLLEEWGSVGTGDARIGPGANRMDLGPGTVYIADTEANHVQVFGRNGSFRFGFGNDTQEDGWCVTPTDVAVDEWGHIYAVDTGNDRIQKFALDGTFVTKWGTSGSGPGEFDSPRGIAAQKNGQIFVWDTGNNRIQVFEPDGTFVRTWKPIYEEGEIEPWPNSFSWYKSTAPFKSCGIAVSDDGVVYIPDWRRHCIVEFDTQGTVLDHWGEEGKEPGQFSFPGDVEVGPDGSLWVLDTRNNRVQHFIQGTCPRLPPG